MGCKMDTILIIMASWVVILLLPAISFHKVAEYLRKYSHYQLKLKRRAKIQQLRIAHQ